MILMRDVITTNIMMGIADTKTAVNITAKDTKSTYNYSFCYDFVIFQTPTFLSC